jgi:hypothetical protein
MPSKKLKEIIALLPTAQTIVIPDEWFDGLACCHRDCIAEPSSATLPLLHLTETDWVDALIDFAECHDVPNELARVY